MLMQLVLSILGLAVAVAAILVLAVRLLVRLARKRSPGWPLAIGVLAVATPIAAISTFGLVRTVAEMASEGKDALRAAEKTVAGTAQNLLARTVEFGTVGVLEGFGRAADHFQAKWRAQSRSQAEALSPAILSAKRIGDRLNLVLSFENATGAEIDLKEVVASQFLLLEDDRGICYPLTPDAVENAALPPGRTSVRQIHVALPPGFAPTALVTPKGRYPLWPANVPGGSASR